MLAAVSAKRCFHPPPLSWRATPVFPRPCLFSFAKTSFPRRNGATTFYRAKNEDEGQDRFFLSFFFFHPPLSTVVEHNCIEGIELVTRDTAACNRRHNWKHWPCLIFLFTPLANLFQQSGGEKKNGGREGAALFSLLLEISLESRRAREYVLRCMILESLFWSLFFFFFFFV